MEFDDLCSRFDVTLSLEKYIDLRFTVGNTFQKLRLGNSKLLPAVYPQKPIIIDIATICKKGCNKYYKILTSKGQLYNGNSKREDRWHEELQCNLSSEFWNKARHQYSTIDCDNTLKWLQFRIVRNCLPTNKIVCKFINTVQLICGFCLDPSSLELISHIFWHCVLKKQERNYAPKRR